MSKEDQERVEDYLELERYLQELQAGHVAYPPTELTPSKARIYRMAALVRSASPKAAEPSPEFVAELKARLEHEFGQSTPTQKLPVLHEKRPRQVQEKPGQVSRRALLTGGAAAAASLVIGAGSEHIAEQAGGNPPPSTALISPDVPTTWHFVTMVAQLGRNAYRFVADTVIGYVIYADEDADKQDRGKIIAMSAACTHRGCIVQWQSSDRTYQCPCHAGSFTEYGKVDTAQGRRFLSPLPRLETKVEDGKIYVKVPVT